MKVKEESEKIGLKLNIQKTKIMASSSITLWQIDGETMETVRDYFFGVPKSLHMLTAAMKLKNACSLEEKLDQPRQHIKKQRHYFADKGPSSQGYGFSSGHVWMWDLDYKESWVQKNWCFWTMVLEKTLESPLDCKEIQPAHPKGDQSWVFIGRTDAEAETPILWPPDAKNWLIWKEPDAGKDWRQEEKGKTDGWMASPTQWAWVSNSRRQWRTGKPGTVQFMGLQSRTWLSKWTTVRTHSTAQGSLPSFPAEKEIHKRVDVWARSADSLCRTSEIDPTL